MEPEAYHLFEKYLNNDLDPSEKANFDKRMAEDPEFAETFRTYKDIQASLLAREDRKPGEAELRKNLEALSEEFFEGKPAERSAKIIPIKRLFQLAAACMVILLGVWFFFNQKQPESLYAQYATYEELALAERGDEDSLKVLAENAFNNGQYEIAAGALDELLRREPENTVVKLYLGIALTETGQFDRAETILSEIHKGGSIFQHTAAWRLALTYLKQNKTEASKTILQEIPETAEEYDNANELLEEFKRRD